MRAELGSPATVTEQAVRRVARSTKEEEKRARECETAAWRSSFGKWIEIYWLVGS